jgi:hypothetical protein
MIGIADYDEDWFVILTALQFLNPANCALIERIRPQSVESVGAKRDDTAAGNNVRSFLQRFY